MWKCLGEEVSPSSATSQENCKFGDAHSWLPGISTNVFVRRGPVGKGKYSLLQSQPGPSWQVLKIKAKPWNWNFIERRSGRLQCHQLVPWAGRLPQAVQAAAFSIWRSLQWHEVIAELKTGLCQRWRGSVWLLLRQIFNYVLMSWVHVFIYHFVPSTSSIRELQNMMWDCTWVKTMRS